jgi:hypothetical protein
MDCGPHFRQPSLINNELSITAPSPNHMKNPVPFSSFNNEGFYPVVTQLSLYTPSKFLKMPTKQVRRASNRSSKINPRKLTITRFGLIAPTRETLENPPLLP